MTNYLNEINKSCCAVLRRHFPDDFIDGRSIEDVEPEELEGYRQCHFFAGIGGFSLAFEGECPDVDVWTGGFPCQDLSLAGKRKGLAGSRSGLYFSFHRLIVSRLPGWVVLENVPGLLSSNGGRDFAIVVGGLTGVVPEVPEKGWGNAGFFRGPVYSVAYRVLDAQFFGVPQRRRRVFIVASLGNGRCAEVLFERESGTGDFEQGREAGKEVAQSLGFGSTTDHYDPEYQTYIVEQNNVVSTPDMISLRSNPACPIIMAHGQANAEIVSDGEPSLTVNHEAPILFDGRNLSEGDVSHTLQAKKGYSLNSVPIAIQLVGVRRLTPTECARLQGFPDNWNDQLSDSARYRQFGNAVAIPVVRWIACRIKENQ